MKILFQGDSITDAGRDKRNYHDLGKGYPKYAAEAIRAANPDREFEFINFGISGNRTCQLFDRLYADAIAFQPDIISILIGINDIWHRYEKTPVFTTDVQIKTNSRAILEALRKHTKAKIVMIAPYVLDAADKEHLRKDAETLLPIVRELGEEFADVYIPLDELFAEAMKTQPQPCYYSGDGVHPNSNGAAFIGEAYAKAIQQLL